MADIRRSAPQVGLAASAGVMPPAQQTVPVADFINAVGEFEKGFSLGSTERELVDYAKQAKKPESFEDNDEWRTIQSKWDRKLLQLKQQRKRPFQINNKINEKARELAMEHPRFKADIFKLAKGLGVNDQVEPPSKLETMIEDAQAKALLWGVSTDSYIDLMARKEKEEYQLGLREVRIKQRNISQAELLDMQRGNVDTRQRLLLMDLSSMAESGQQIDGNQFASRVDQVINAELQDWSEASLRATGFRPSSEDMKKAREELGQSYGWIKDMAGERDSAKLAARAKQFMSDTFEMELNKSMPVFMAARKLVGTENVFGLMDMLSKTSTESQRQALINSNPVFGALSSQQFKDSAGAAIAKAFGVPSPFQLTPQQNEAVSILSDQVSKDVIEKDAVAKRRERVFQSLKADGKPVKMLSMYGSNKAYKLASDNKHEVDWFKEEWARQTQSNLAILNEARQLGVGFRIGTPTSSGDTFRGGIKFDEANKPEGQNLNKFMRDHARYNQALQNLNRLGGYLSNGWDAVFMDSGLTRDNVYEGFISTIQELPEDNPSDVPTTKNAPVEAQPTNGLQAQAEALFKESPDATIKDLLDFLKAQNA